MLDKHKKALAPCTPGRAHELLDKGRAIVHRVVPFTIRMKDRVGGVTQPTRICIDPGSKTTGIAVVREVAVVPVVGDTEAMPEAVGPERHVLWAAELTHRGSAIRDALTQRSGYRRRRRSANIRYRAPRFDNRRPAKGTLPPSLRHRLETTGTWAARILRSVPVTALSMELVRFDMQAMQNPDIGGVEYQQGTLKGYEIREYLLEKWKRTCAYCDAQNVPLEIDHVVADARGGSWRIGNLTIACRPCNQRKGARRVEDFLARDPKRLAKILSTLTRPLADAAAVNATRWALHRALVATGLPVETGSGGRTKWNRTRLGVAKTHAGDALCVGSVGAIVGWPMAPLAIQCTGRGAYQRTRVTASGFPRGYAMRGKSVHGFRTGDLVVAVVPTGKKRGTHRGRVAIRATGKFNIRTCSGVVQGIGHRYCRLVQRGDGYGYSRSDASPIGSLLPALVGGVSAPSIESQRTTR